MDTIKKLLNLLQNKDKVKYRKIVDNRKDKIHDGTYFSKCVSWHINDNRPSNAWIEFANLEYSDKDTFWMNLYLPTREALNDRMAKLKVTLGNSTPELELKEHAFKPFSRYFDIMRNANIKTNVTIRETLNALVGWTGKASYINDTSHSYWSTRIAKILPGGELSLRANSIASSNHPSGYLYGSEEDLADHRKKL